MQSAPKPTLLAGLLEDGALNVAAAMRAVLPGDMWRARRAAAIDDEAGAAGAAIRLKVSAKSRIRAGRSATVRWTATGAERVVSWRVSLNGKRIKTLPGTKSLLRKRVNTPGTHRWKVVGVDADGRAGRLRRAQVQGPAPPLRDDRSLRRTSAARCAHPRRRARAARA